MTNGTFSRLALLGLAAVASTAFAASTISGTIRLDAQFPDRDVVSSTQTEATENDDKNNFDVTRARVNVAGDVAPDFTYFVRLDASQGFASNSAVSVSQAYATWHGMDGMSLNIGKTAGPSFSADEHYYKPYIVHDENTGRALGVVKERNGDHAGIDLSGSVSMLNYSVGLWKASDESAYKLVAAELRSYGPDSPDAGSRLRFGYGFRAAVNAVDSDKMQLGVGVGFSSTPITAKVGMIGQIDGAAQRYYSSFDKQMDFTVDACAVFGALQMNAGYFNQKINQDLNLGNEAATNTVKVDFLNNLFNNDAKHVGYYGEVGYLIIGDGYKYDSSKSVVSGVKLNDGQGGLELVLRVGSQIKEDAIAYMAYSGEPYDNTVLATGRKTGNHFRIRDKGYSVNANYYVNSNTVLKAQYSMVDHDIDNFAGSFTDGSRIDPAANNLFDYKQTKTLSLRAEYSF